MILGDTGRNFAAGMSGGIAFIYDVKGNFPDLCNKEMVDLDPVLPEDRDELYRLISNHYAYTKSTAARFVLDDFDAQLLNFVKVFPKDFKRVLALRREKEGVVMAVGRSVSVFYLSRHWCR